MKCELLGEGWWTHEALLYRSLSISHLNVVRSVDFCPSHPGIAIQLFTKVTIDRRCHRWVNNLGSDIHRFLSPHNKNDIRHICPQMYHSSNSYQHAMSITTQTVDIHKNYQAIYHLIICPCGLRQAQCNIHMIRTTLLAVVAKALLL